jgi:SAM-dependent methyltransferase
MPRGSRPGYRRRVIYQHPLAYLIGLEGLALLRAWGGDYDERFVRRRLDEVRSLLADETLTTHPGVLVEPDATQDAYGQWAAAYDDDGNELLEMDLPAIDDILDSLGPGGTAVDAACGTGRLAARLVERGYDVTGVDSSLEMLHQARRRVPGAAFVAGDLQHLPLRDGSVDLLTSGLALTHVPRLDPVLAEFARVLRPGGTVILSDVHPDLVYRGSVVKGASPTGQPQVASCHRHTVADYLRGALAAGFRVQGLAEEPRPAPGAQHPQPTPEPVRELGEWRYWPWTLLQWTPEAARAAWDHPSVMVWHLALDGWQGAGGRCVDRVATVDGGADDL